MVPDRRPLVDLGDRRIVVTGGAAGIGAAIVRCALGLGARVGVVDLHPPDDDTPYVQADVGSVDSATAAVRDLACELGGVDVLVNNAGVAPAERVDEITEEGWRQTMGVNLDGAFFCTRAALSLLRVSESPAVVNLASIAGRTYSRTASVSYAASKGGVVALTRQLAHELAPERIRVNCVCPGLVDTAIMTRNVTPARLAELEETIPLGRLAAPAEVAAVVCFLASSAASYLTGAVVDVTGGLA